MAQKLSEKNQEEKAISKVVPVVKHWEKVEGGDVHEEGLVKGQTAMHIAKSRNNRVFIDPTN